MDRVLSVVPTRTTLPVLSNVLIVCESDRVRFQSTDLDVSLTTTLDAKVSKAGALTVPARRVADFVRKLEAETVEMEVADNRLTVASGSARARVPGMGREEFPNPPDLEGSTTFEVDGAVLEGMIRKTSHAVSKDDTRPALAGVLWELKPDSFAMVATDGHRLVLERIKGDMPVKEPLELIVPQKALNQLLPLLGDGGQARLMIKDSHVGFEVGDTVLYSRLIEGPFPRYEPVIPKDNDKILHVDRERLRRAVERASVWSDRVTHQVKFSLRKGAMEIAASTPDHGEMNEVVEVSYQDEDLEVGYDASYVIDILRHIHSPQIEWSFKTAISAGLIRPAEMAEGHESLALIMPLRLSD
jgi:DNA polymerase-3 subunit beta